MSPGSGRKGATVSLTHRENDRHLMEDNENPTPETSPSFKASEPSEHSAPSEASATSETIPPIVGAGRRVREAREKAGITVAKLAADLRISPALLEALEAGQYEKFAGAPYVRATLVSLSRPLRLDSKELLKAYADEMGSQDAPSVQVSPYKDDSGTHAKAHKQIFILLLAVLLFILLLIMGKVNTSAPESGPAAPATNSDTLLSIDPVPEGDSLSLPAPDSAGSDSVPRDTASAAVKTLKKTEVRVQSIVDSVWLRALPAGDRESSRMLRRHKSIEFSHTDSIVFITSSVGSVRVFVGDTSLIPTHRRFKVDGDRVAY